MLFQCRRLEEIAFRTCSHLPDCRQLSRPAEPRTGFQGCFTHFLYLYTLCRRYVPFHVFPLDTVNALCACANDPNGQFTPNQASAHSPRAVQYLTFSFSSAFRPRASVTRLPRLGPILFVGRVLALPSPSDALSFSSDDPQRPSPLLVSFVCF